MSRRIYRLTPTLLAGIAVLSGGSPLPGQRAFNASSDTGRIDAPARSAVLLAAAQLLEDFYVFPDSGRQLAEFLRRKAVDTSYVAINQAGAFGAAVTGALRGLSHDKHLAVLAPALTRALQLNRDGTADLSARAASERGRDYFFEEYRRLDGNVGYLRLRQFPVPDSSARATAAAAMRLLANADAVILDLRDNPGGAEGLNQWLSSYFFDDSSRVLYRRYYRQGDSTVVVHVLPTLPGPRMPATPLFVLVNARTGSAAENMAYALQTAGRATIVGEATAGAANSSTIMALPAGFAMQVPIARVTSPVTGTNWEATGVQPDVRTASDSAESAALALARAPRTPQAAVTTSPPREAAADTGERPRPPTRIIMPATVEVPLAGPGGDGSARPAVEIRINGHGPYRFLVETGAPGIDLSPALADSLHLRLVGHTSDGPLFHVDSIDVGAASFQDVTVSTLPSGVAAMGITGVLGLAFYQDLLLTVDYPARQLILTRDTLPAQNGADVLPLTRVGAFWGLPISIGGHPFIGVLDTQNSRSLLIPPSIGEQLAFDGGLQVLGKARGAFGTVDVKGGRLSGDIVIGKYSFPNPMLALTQLPPDYPSRPNVGSGILRYFVVSIDQRRGRIRLSRDGSSTISLPEPAGGRGNSAAPATPAPTAFAALTGVFGDRTVSLIDGKFTLQRPGGQPNELVMMARDSFAIAGIPQARIVFVRDATGTVNEIRVFNAEGRWESVKRADPSRP